MKHKIFYLIIFTISALIFITACGSGKSEFVGKWELEGSSGDYMELFSDGTCIIDDNSGMWDIKDGRFVLTVQAYGSSYGVSFDYKVSKNELVFIDNDGSEERYVKANSSQSPVKPGKKSDFIGGWISYEEVRYYSYDEAGQYVEEEDAVTLPFNYIVFFQTGLV